jgi:hypothetical protein
MCSVLLPKRVSTQLQLNISYHIKKGPGACCSLCSILCSVHPFKMSQAAATKGRRSEGAWYRTHRSDQITAERQTSAVPSIYLSSVFTPFEVFTTGVMVPCTAALASLPLKCVSGSLHILSVYSRRQQYERLDLVSVWGGGENRGRGTGRLVAVCYCQRWVERTS